MSESIRRFLVSTKRTREGREFCVGDDTRSASCKILGESQVGQSASVASMSRLGAFLYVERASSNGIGYRIDERISSGTQENKRVVQIVFPSDLRL